MSGQGRVAGRKRPKELATMGRAKRATQRAISHKFEIKALGYRGHNMEYADPMGFPCGKIIYVPDHFRTCKECDSIRTILDTWAEENARIADAEGTDYKSPPALTHAALKMIVRNMGITLEDIKKQDDGWNPYKPIRKPNELGGGTYITKKSLVEVYEGFSDKLKLQCLRPTLPSLIGIDNRPVTFGTVPCLHRQLNTKNELMEYVVKSSICDGKVDNDYLNMVVANFGGVKMDEEGYQKLTGASGMDSDELRDMIPNQPVAGEVDLKDFMHSPRFLSGLDIPYDRNSRMSGGQQQQIQEQQQQIKQQQIEIQQLKKKVQELEKKVRVCIEREKRLKAVGNQQKAVSPEKKPNK